MARDDLAHGARWLVRLRAGRRRRMRPRWLIALRAPEPHRSSPRRQAPSSSSWRRSQPLTPAPPFELPPGPPSIEFDRHAGDRAERRADGAAARARVAAAAGAGDRAARDQSAEAGRTDAGEAARAARRAAAAADAGAGCQCRRTRRRPAEDRRRRRRRATGRAGRRRVGARPPAEGAVAGRAVGAPGAARALSGRRTRSRPRPAGDGALLSSTGAATSSRSQSRRVPDPNLLDTEAEAMIRRASPLPVPPDQVAADALELVVPVRFKARR